MKNICALFVFIFTFLLFLKLAISQIQLVPGIASFEVKPIILTPLEPFADYTSTSQYLALKGDIEYLLISWNATYLEEERDIGVLCYLNCPNLGTEDIEETCAGVQNCSYLGPTGYRSCSIQNPVYFYNESNNVACKFYDPANPTILFINLETGKPYIERNFSTINFSLQIEAKKINVGESFNLPIKIKNFGLFKTSFGTKISTLQENIIIKNPESFTDEISYGEVAATFPSITFLIEQKAIFKIVANSTKDKFECLSDSDCSHFNENGIVGICIDNTCHKQLELSIEAGKASLKDFTLIQLILFIPIILIFYALIEKKGKSLN